MLPAAHSLGPSASSVLYVLHPRHQFDKREGGREGAGTRVRSTQRVCHVRVCVMGI